MTLVRTPAPLRRLRVAIKRLVNGDLPLSERRINDPVVYPIQDGAYVAVYWKALPIGRGPCASLYVLDREILRFDCFGEGKGHFHANIAQRNLLFGRSRNRRYFVERTIEEQIERAAIEIKTRAAEHLRASRDPRIAGFVLGRKGLERACDAMQQQMLEYLRAVPALRDRRSSLPTQGRATPGN